METNNIHENIYEKAEESADKKIDKTPNNAHIEDKKSEDEKQKAKQEKEREKALENENFSKDLERKELEIKRLELRLKAKEALIQKGLPDFCIELINKESEGDIQRSLELIERLLYLNRGLEMPLVDEKGEKGLSYSEMLNKFIQKNPEYLSRR